MPNEATLNSKIEAIMGKYEGGGKLKKVEFEDAYWRN